MELKINYPFTPKDRGKNKFLTKVIDTPKLRKVYKETFENFKHLKPYFDKIPVNGAAADLYPYWLNGWFPTLDSISLYGFLATRNPSIYIEVGSGNSTKFARQAVIDHNLQTKIISIDPKPRADIDKLCDEVHRVNCEDIDISIFADLPSDAIVFIDNSHHAFQNSDVTVFFTEILPSLPSGVLWGCHDIFLPYDYIPKWYGRYYNEQYLFAAYLLGGHINDEILLPNWFVTKDKELLETVNDLFLKDSYYDNVKKGGGCFWCQRK